ncbi:uncharacterized protein SCHCODRAFT_02630379 [Schizophyllum commune H4-8]|uniref:uncharacterized protein n=1 Tax=Schizophyllum commune (strain H4-8 / FGSC 9210) TaxID=578458 RepID=UPI0021606ABD|nr:uncharacterized protein SCHCODRAFT_02630379 [Schizophyllum commune H4-8]KAI5889908.1 hypothetical protein SCHCODRAFT_02630379 [Schizophyllum commune H4-8]
MVQTLYQCTSRRRPSVIVSIGGACFGYTYLEASFVDGPLRGGLLKSYVYTKC